MVRPAVAAPATSRARLGHPYNPARYAPGDAGLASDAARGREVRDALYGQRNYLTLHTRTELVHISRDAPRN